MVDLSLLKQYGRVAVRCDSEEEAMQFMEAMWEQHPEKVSGAWNRGQTNWNYRRDKDSICYVPRIFHSVTDDELSICQSSRLGWVEEHGYHVISFKALVQEMDLGELTTADVDIKSLFGMG